jgi:hypothetical protein
MSEHDKKFFNCNIDDLEWWEFFRKTLNGFKTIWGGLKAFYMGGKEMNDADFVGNLKGSAVRGISCLACKMLEKIGNRCCEKLIRKIEMVFLKFEKKI